jgi:hypothetical protein
LFIAKDVGRGNLEVRRQTHLLDVLSFGRGKWHGGSHTNGTDDPCLAELMCREFTMYFIDYGLGLAFYQQLHAAISAISFNFPLCDMPRIGESSW